jgi:hypothetical protein
MPAGQTIHLYTLCWNDSRMLPFFFRHYDALVDHFFFYDNGSTDATLEILRAHPRVTVRHFDTPGDSFVKEELRLSETMWKESRGKADWVFVLDLDEHLFRPDLIGYLRRCTDQGITAVRAIGFDMVADRFPHLDTPLLEQVTRGARSLGFDKLCAFNPDAIRTSGYEPGRHDANPRGRVKWPERSEVLMLHFKQMGVDYPIARSAELRSGLGAGDIENGWGTHYSLTAAAIARVWADIRDAALAIPGLGPLAGVPPELYDDEFVVRGSGLFDAEWYLRTYPDIDEAGIDALAHFCSHGWREGRRPNFYFDCEWIQETYPELMGLGGNPLVHYIRGAADADLRPSIHFDPAWYRKQYRVDPRVHALRHYLENMTSEKVGPHADFLVAHYCSVFPRSEREFADPYEDYCRRNEDQ